MNLHKTLISIALIFLSTHFLYADGIEFQHTSWAEVQQLAKKQNKHIFVDAFTTWCGPCKWMSEEVFPKKEVGEFFNQHFVSFKMDMEKGEGVDFAIKYAIRAYPTFLFFSPEGNLVHKFVGGREPEMFITSAKDALQPDKQVYTLKSKFDNGETNREFLINYLNSLNEAGDDVNEVLKRYLNNTKPTQWEEDWSALMGLSIDINSPLYQQVKNQKARYIEISSEASVREFLDRGINDKLNQIFSQTNKSLEEMVNEAKTLLNSTLDQKEANARIAEIEMLAFADSPNSFQYATNYFDNYCDNPDIINNYVWQMVDMYDFGDAKFNKGLAWVEKAISMNPENSLYWDTKAWVLYKLNKKSEAKKAADETIRLAKKQGVDYSTTTELLELLK
jgi:thioredoxin-related protein